ncbi:tetratricopeptide repeat protein [Micromonospora sp. WMMD1082]|uniref:tetratricopeptide repeat protein n=1 Tax=Micromonospora sp. WMMD1082 TaxID=3016104 RepID=UPI00241697C2|nr:tetratricopeptide repeat protein [Micromonospora sp. WMMD1082]MDG4795686.1 tetratricopeptide repeat protein [Micromonospora sp. WMMD1082]
MKLANVIPLRDGESEVGSSRSISFSPRDVRMWGHLSLSWSDMTGLETATTDNGEMPPSLAFHRGPVVTRFLLPGRTLQQVRDDLRSWVMSKMKEKEVIHLEWNLEVGESGATIYERRIRQRKVTKDWALGWVETAEKQRQEGNTAAALSILEAAVKVSTATFGPTAAATVAARNNWAYTLAVTGSRSAAIPIYWALLDDVTEAQIRVKYADNDDGKALGMARRNALRNLAMLHNPRWRP